MEYERMYKSDVATSIYVYIYIYIYKVFMNIYIYVYIYICIYTYIHSIMYMRSTRGRVFVDHSALSRIQLWRRLVDRKELFYNYS